MDTIVDIKKQYSREYYLKHRDKIKAKRKLRRAANPELTKKIDKRTKEQLRLKSIIQRQKVREYVQKIKKDASCSCGENHPACLAFHHRDALDKELSINEAIKRGWSIQRTQKEIDKCDILCFNCHARVHWTKNNEEFIYGNLS